MQPTVNPGAIALQLATGSLKIKCVANRYSYSYRLFKSTKLVRRGSPVVDRKSSCH